MSAPDLAEALALELLLDLLEAAPVRLRERVAKKINAITPNQPSLRPPRSTHPGSEGRSSPELTFDLLEALALGLGNPDDAVEDGEEGQGGEEEESSGAVNRA